MRQLFVRILLFLGIFASLAGSGLAQHGVGDAEPGNRLAPPK